MTQKITEKYLLLRAKNKDGDAFAKLYDIYVDRIYRFIYFKVSSKEEAQDLTSEVFLKTWQYITDGNKIDNLNALFYKIARNLVIDHYRKAARKEVSMDMEVAEYIEAKVSIENEELNRTEKDMDIKLGVAVIEAKLKDLKHEYREIIVLRYIEELSVAEIAVILGKKSGAVRITLYRATKTLKELVDGNHTISNE